MKYSIVPKGVLFRDAEEKRVQESRNGVIQGRFVVHTLDQWDSGEEGPHPANQLTPNLLKELQRLAVNQIYRCAGHFRDGAVIIQDDQSEQAQHKPPEPGEIDDLVDELCSYVNERWASDTPVHLAAYVMWRMNWIHPFFGGNGRTSRAASYLVLCGALGFKLPGELTIPELVVDSRNEYVRALRLADTAWSNNSVDVSAMESLLSALLAQQLADFHRAATGVAIDPPSTASG